MNEMQAALLFTLKVLVLFAWAWDFGLALLMLMSHLKARNTLTSSLPKGSTSPRHRFAFLIPAHNEEKVIGPLLDSINRQSYPSELYKVYIAADRCTDKTAEVARSKGATVIERWEGQSGKTWNIRYALEKIPLEAYDYLVIVDADNLVAPDFLREVDRFLQENPNTKALQGYLDVKNPFDTWVTKAIAVAYWVTNLVWFRSREVLGLSATLGGTGMVLSTALLRERGWKAESLTEDLELHVDLVLQGERVRYLETARVYDEKPLDLRASYRQRVRWYQGHWYLLFKKAPLVLGSLLTRKSNRPLVLFDTLLYLLAPARYLASLALLLNFLVDNLAVAHLGKVGAYLAFLVLIYGTLSGTIASLARFGKLRLNVLEAGLYVAPYGFVWFPVAVHALLKAHDQGYWVKTSHERRIGVEELEEGALLGREESMGSPGGKK
ncbi:glycosyl transferase family 2 [Thermus thermophilus]|nr:glycosyl transferase family 2 [Thermus thermophilus]